MAQASYSPAKPQLSAEQFYDQIRSRVETPEQIGRLIIMDPDSGDYEVDTGNDDLGLEASRRLQSRHPGASLHALRIGYRTAASFCGVLERLEAE